MDYPLAVRQRVYLYGRAVFSGDDAQIRKRKKVRALVRNYRVRFGPLLRELGEPKLVEVLRRLLEDRIFASVLRAEAEFPSLFITSPHRHAQREASEINAARSTQEALEHIHSDNEEEPSAQKAIEDDGTGTPRHAPHSILGPMASLYPSYIPYKAQHLLLTTAQQILEECCFDFAEKWLPDVVHYHGWDCAAAVELTQWTKILCHKDSGKLPPHALSLTGSALKELFINTHKLRHTAVHRVPTTARGISQLLQFAVYLAEALQDHERASQLEGLKSEVDGKITVMELNKNVLENNTTEKLEEIQRQREELERQEQELLANMMREDLDNKALIGRLLEQSVEHFLAQDAACMEAKALDEIDGDSVSDESDEGKGTDAPKEMASEGT